MDARVRAVREDTGDSKAVGRGSCSWMDETMDDAELLKAIEESEATTPEAAVRAMRELNELLRENEREASDGYEFWKW